MKLIKLLFLAVIVTTMSSCTELYYCYVNGTGSKPADKSFYIAPATAEQKQNAEYMAFGEAISRSLEEIGYVEGKEGVAELRVEYKYEVGNVGDIVVQDIIMHEEDGEVNVGVEGEGNVEAKRMKPTYVNYPGVPLHYDVPIECEIAMVESATGQAVWRVKVVDVINFMEGKKKPTFSSVMPWFLLSAQKYFGKEGTFIAKASKYKGVKKLGYEWPY